MLNTVLSIATLVGSILGSVIMVQKIYMNHLNTKKLKKELKKMDKEDSS
ncbi:uncharacterized membrane protein YciS (DUF1049 family) [Lactobacillus colini]|uniref:Uncharacterized membrane protein YciS (DUF1049 family) n=1 Tax=Lactobacillus colini TaxID=1819254 RepID=A0ABS4MEZ7_9LACO|nr:hypothetical protein [Lactobacillus colini]MBP2057916.1 uncharacterized membrane protein YciS (DUF1049 family) [Lactobacillus colini]